MQSPILGRVDNYTQRLADALVSEIKAEMGRQDLSSRALGRLIGESSQYMSTRLDGGNPRTGERVTLNVRDLYSIASALRVDPLELMARAQRIASEGTNVKQFPSRNVGGSAQTDLETVELNTTQLAASTDNTPIDPSRGEG
jgi:hypothetical protein